MRISDWSSDVCSSDLEQAQRRRRHRVERKGLDMVEDGFRPGEQHIVEAGYLRHSRARPDIPSFLRRLADPVRHEFEKILEAGGQTGLLVERGGRHQITRSADASIVYCWPDCARIAQRSRDLRGGTEV